MHACYGQISDLREMSAEDYVDICDPVHDIQALLRLGHHVHEDVFAEEFLSRGQHAVDSGSTGSVPEEGRYRAQRLLCLVNLLVKGPN